MYGGTTQEHPLLGDIDIKLSDPTQPREIEGTESFSVFGFLGKGWKTTLLSTFISTVELICIGYGLVNIDKLYDDYQEGHDPINDFSGRVLGPFIIAKFLDGVNDWIITRHVIKQSAQVAETVADKYFSSPDYKEGDSSKVGRLIFDSFDIIRPTLNIVHSKIIFKLLEMIIFGGSIVGAKECDIRDVLTIGGISFAGVLIILGCERKVGKIGIKRQNYIEKYEDLYGYISTTVNNYETVRVLGAKEKLIADITSRISDFTQRLDKDIHGFSLTVSITDFILFVGMTTGAVALASSRGYRGDQFFYLFAYAMQQSQNLRDFSEAFYKLWQADASFNEINEYVHSHRTPLCEHKLENKPHLIQFDNVRHGKFTQTQRFSIQPEDKVIVEGPSGCGKSSILKLLSGLHRLDPGNGSITIGEKPLPSISNLTDHLTYIHAETQIFPYSLVDNIRISDSRQFKKSQTSSTVIPKEVKEAAEQAVLSQEIKEAHTKYKNAAGMAILSTGQKKRVGLARLFMKMTQILLIDEPLSGLDATAAKTFLDNLYKKINPEEEKGKEKEKKHENHTVLIVEHRKEFENHDIHLLFNKKIQFMENGDVMFFKLKPTSEDKSIKIGQWQSNSLSK